MADAEYDPVEAAGIYAPARGYWIWVGGDEDIEANLGTLTAIEKKKNRTFKKFSYRGVDLDQSVYRHRQILF